VRACLAGDVGTTVRQLVSVLVQVCWLSAQLNGASAYVDDADGRLRCLPTDRSVSRCLQMQIHI